MELVGGLACVAVVLLIVAGAFVLPLVTFLLLFTTLGNAAHRALRGKPLRAAYRFDLRALIVLITFSAVSISWLKASAYPVHWEHYRDVILRPEEQIPHDASGNHDPWFYVANWIVIAIPISMLLAFTRYALDLYDDRRRPLHGPAPPPTTFAGIELPQTPADSAQDSSAPGE